MPQQFLYLIEASASIDQTRCKAKVIGAVFGKAALTNKQYVGIGLYYLDELSFNYGNLLQLAINAR